MCCGVVSFVSVCCVCWSPPAQARQAPSRATAGDGSQPRPAPASRQPGRAAASQARPSQAQERNRNVQVAVTGKSLGWLVASLVWRRAISSFCVTFLSHRLSTWRARHLASVSGYRVLRRNRGGGSSNSHKRGSIANGKGVRPCAARARARRSRAARPSGR